MNTITESQMNEIVHTLADTLEAAAAGRIGIDRNELNEKLEYLLLDIRIKVVEDPKETPVNHPVQFNVQGPVKYRYQVLGDHSVDNLAATVNRLMEEGWSPLGAPFQRRDRAEWCQAMVYAPWSLKVSVEGPGPVADVKPEDIYKRRNEVAKIAAKNGEIITPMAVQSVLEKERKEVRNFLVEIQEEWAQIAGDPHQTDDDPVAILRFRDMAEAIRLAIIDLDIRSTDQLPK